MDPYAWAWNVEALVVIPALTIGYLWALRRFPAPGWRVACFLLGVALLLAVTVTPAETLGLGYLLTVHLLQNVVLAEWAPALVVLGLPPALAAALPVPRALVVPWVALPLWLANYVAWHLPWAYDAALEQPHSLLHLEHALYFATGILLWWSIFQAAPVRLSPGAKAGTILAGFVLASPIGLMLALVPEPIYDFYVDAPRLWGLTPLEDQQVAGVTMAAEQAVVFFAVCLVFVLHFLREQENVADGTNHGAMSETPEERRARERRAEADRRNGEERRADEAPPPPPDEEDKRSGTDRRSGEERRSGKDRRDEP